MSGPEQLPQKEALAEITINHYTEADKESLMAGMADIQEIERDLSDTRRPGKEMATEYLDEVLKEVGEKSGAVFVARNGAEVAGFITCWIEHDHDPIQTKEANTYGYISDAWVSPHLRDQGLFKRLNDQVENYFKQFPEVHYLKLGVMSGNARAQAAYEKVGFTPEVVTMTKRIAPADPEEK